MPAPKQPNTAAATAATRRRGDETAAARLRAHGWTVIPPGTERIKHSIAETEQSGRWCPTCDEPVTGWKMSSELPPLPREPERRYESVKPAKLAFEPCGHPVPPDFDPRLSPVFRLHCVLCGEPEKGHDKEECDAKMRSWRPTGISELFQEP